MPAVVPAVPWLQHVGQARNSGEIEQREPISIAFVGPVRAVTLSSTGSLWCSGFLGRMVGFRDGTEVVRADNVLIDPSDCGLDDVTYGVRGELPPEVDIDSLVIEGVDPWVAPVLGNCCGRALLKYTVQYQPAAVVCTASVTRGPEVVCEVTPASLSVTGWDFVPDAIPGIPLLPGVQETSTAQTWRGVGAVGGTVTAHVTLGETSLL